MPVALADCATDFATEIPTELPCKLIDHDTGSGVTEWVARGGGGAMRMAYGEAPAEAMRWTGLDYFILGSSCHLRLEVPASGNFVFLMRFGRLDAGESLRWVVESDGVDSVIIGKVESDTVGDIPVYEAAYVPATHRWLRWVGLTGPDRITWYTAPDADAGGEVPGTWVERGTVLVEDMGANMLLEETILFLRFEHVGTSDQEAFVRWLSTVGEASGGLTQSAYQFFEDDDAEGAATPIDAENTPVALAQGDTFRLRKQIASSGDAGAFQSHTRVRRVGSASGIWWPLKTPY